MDSNKELSIKWYQKELGIKKTVFESNNEYGDYYCNLFERYAELVGISLTRIEDGYYRIDKM